MNKIIFIFLITVLTASVSAASLAETTTALEYTLGPVTKRNTISGGTGFDLTYNLRTGNFPHLFIEGDSGLDLMIVNLPPNITDTFEIFDYKKVRTGVAWSVMSMNLSHANATVKLDRTIDFTNTKELNLDLNVNLTYNFIYFNSTAMREMNVSATLTLNSLNFTAVKILKDNIDCIDCQVLSYVGGKAVFTVDPTISTYMAEELAGWISWNMIDLSTRWIGTVGDNQGVILIGDESGSNTLRQYYSSNATDNAFSPILEVNYTIRDMMFYNNETMTNIIDLNDYFWDSDADDLTFTTSDDHPNINITIDEELNTVSMYSINNWNGTEYVVFTAYDARGGEVSSNNVTIRIVMGVTTTTTTTTTTNPPPIVGAIDGPGKPGDEMTLIPGAAKNFIFNASVYDGSGCAEITEVKAILWENSSVAFNSPNNNLNHYVNESCDISCQGNDGFVKCAFNVLYYAAPSGDWRVNISAYDGINRGFNVSMNYSLLDMTGMNISRESVTFTSAGGAIALGGLSDQTSIKVTNLGNVVQDALVSGTNLTCEIAGPMNVNQIKYDTNVGKNYAAMCGILTWDSADTCIELSESFNLAPTTDGTPSERTIYWGLEVPPSGVGGSCTGTLYVDTIAN